VILQIVTVRTATARAARVRKVTATFRSGPPWQVSPVVDIDKNCPLVTKNSI
jgi:hypothetical protein